MIIKNFDYYHKKLYFETNIKILLHAFYEELPSYHEIGRLLWLNDCAEKSVSIRFRIAFCLAGGDGNKHEYLDGTNLVQMVSTKCLSSKTSSLQLNDSTTIPLNKTWLLGAKFRQTKSSLPLLDDESYRP